MMLAPVLDWEGRLPKGRKLSGNGVAEDTVRAAKPARMDEKRIVM